MDVNGDIDEANRRLNDNNGKKKLDFDRTVLDTEKK